MPHSSVETKLGEFRLAVLMSVTSHEPTELPAFELEHLFYLDNCSLLDQMFLSYQAIAACHFWVKRSLKDVAPVKSFQNSQSSTGLHWIMLQRWQIWQMYQMYQTLKLIVKEFLSPLIAMRRPEWMCPPMGPPKHLTWATVARFRTKLFTSRKKDHHIETHQNSELWFDQKQKILFLSPFLPNKNLPPSTWMKLFGVSYLGRKANGLKRPGLAMLRLCSALPEEPLPSIFHHWRLRHLFCGTKGRTQDSIGIVAEGHTQVLQWKGNFRSRFFWNKKWGKCSNHQMTRERG